MKRIDKRYIQGYGILVSVAVFLCMFAPFISLVFLAYGLLTVVEFLGHKLSGTGTFSSELSAHERKEVPGVFHQLMKPEIVEDSVIVSYLYVMPCGCEEPISRDLIERMKKEAVRDHPAEADEISRVISACFLFPAKGLTIKECEDLLNNFSEYYDLLDKAQLISIALKFSFNLKKMQEIDKGYSGSMLVKYLHNDGHGRHIAQMLSDHSAKRLGRCWISYRIIGNRSLTKVREDMFTIPAQAKYATHCEDTILTLRYDGYECGYRSMLEGALEGGRGECHGLDNSLSNK